MDITEIIFSETWNGSVFVMMVSRKPRTDGRLRLQREEPQGRVLLEKAEEGCIANKDGCLCALSLYSVTRNRPCSRIFQGETIYAKYGKANPIGSSTRTTT